MGRASVHGFDVNEGFLEKARNDNSAANIYYHQLDLDAERVEIPVAPRPDIITSFETLEHLENPQKTCELFHEILKDNGTLICSVPNEAYEPKENGVQKNQFHKHLFTRTEAEDLLRNAGFTIKQTLGQPFPNIILWHMPQVSSLIDKAAFLKGNLFKPLSAIAATPTKRLLSKTYSHLFVCDKTSTNRQP